MAGDEAAGSEHTCVGADAVEELENAPVVERGMQRREVGEPLRVHDIRDPIVVVAGQLQQGEPMRRLPWGDPPAHLGKLGVERDDVRRLKVLGQCAEIGRALHIQPPLPGGRGARWWELAEVTGSDMARGLVVWPRKRGVPAARGGLRLPCRWRACRCEVSLLPRWARGAAVLLLAALRAVPIRHPFPFQGLLAARSPGPPVARRGHVVVPPSCKYTCRLYAMESAKTSSDAKSTRHRGNTDEVLVR